MKKFLVWTVVGLAILLVLVALLGILYGFWIVGSTIWYGARELKPEVFVPLSITVLTAILGLSATLYSQNRIRKREIEAAYRERKVEIYLDFLKTLESLFVAAKPDLGQEPIDQNALVLKLMDIRTKAVLWGSTGVLQALSDLTKMGDAPSPRSMFRVMERIQREMRRDLGLSNFGLAQDFFSKMALTDPDELDKLQ
ncbi:hypothetical protein [Octadecabacter sp. R77987]|uniref:hypothetical protein n=1 Tax=Octadecabacter sp. R77987 TaxID=3093874 RepID=UPI0036704F3E